MNTHRSRDEWADAQLGETMHRTLGTMAAQAARDSTLHGAMGSVRSRVRRRRAAKQLGIGATTLAVTAALVVGGAALLPEQSPPPGPAASPSQTPDPTQAAPDASADPTTRPVLPTERPRGDCSAAATRTDMLPAFSELSAPAADTATTLLAAAVDCDDKALVALSTQDGSSTSFGDRTPEEFWTLPGAEEHEDVYAILARILTRLEPAELPASQGMPAMYVWPRLQAGEDSAAAWQEAVDAGLVTPQEADQMRAGGGYLGWRLAITEDGTWQYFIAGD